MDDDEYAAWGREENHRRLAEMELIRSPEQLKMVQAACRKRRSVVGLTAGEAAFAVTVGQRLDRGDSLSFAMRREMTEVDTVEGYAVIEDNKIEVRTVSPTRRAAIVNWLVVRKNCMIYLTTTDDQIEEMWENWSGDTYIASVDISKSGPEF